ncbi:hypothetical protein RFI_14134 [Reticulomyxa filosa]|uniref:Uncharacterized protein n=1 Tax=Reticulomyxa filosa TaxID=46433 RepID=X6NCK3_RETFI|nr:hypothetical protein RFI_14134 [Reticulomyxa filosa]|eukprot:ETO23052.1 hypothetical protein RFI_14134 [Reticulomyxa filosa]
MFALFFFFFFVCLTLISFCTSFKKKKKKKKKMNELNVIELFAVQFIPVLVWCIYNRDARCVSGMVAVLLSLYKKQKYDYKGQFSSNVSSSNMKKNIAAIFNNYRLPDLDFSSVFHNPKNTNPKTWLEYTRIQDQDAVIYPSSLPSIHVKPFPAHFHPNIQSVTNRHHPNPLLFNNANSFDHATTNAIKNNDNGTIDIHTAMHQYKEHANQMLIVNQKKKNLYIYVYTYLFIYLFIHLCISKKKKRNRRARKSHQFYMDDITSANVTGGTVMDHNASSKDKKEKDGNKDKDRFQNDLLSFHFPTLQQANWAANLQLIHVSLQVFNYYISKMNHIVLEQYCAVIAKICSSGLDNSDRCEFPDHISQSFIACRNWKWYGPNDTTKKRFVIPSEILCQFLTGLRYSLNVEKVKLIALFALAQVHKRGHLDTIPEVILQTMSMMDNVGEFDH